MLKLIAAYTFTALFLLIFCLRGAPIYDSLNLTYLFAGVVVLFSLILIFRFLYINRSASPGKAKSLAKRLFLNTTTAVVTPGEVLLVAWVVVLTYLMLFSYFYSPASIHVFTIKALSYLMMHFFLIFFYFMALDFQTVKRMIFILAAVSVPLLACRQLYSYFTTGLATSYPYSLTGRAHGFLADPNEFAKNVVVVVFILLFCVLMERFTSRVKPFIVLGIATMLLMLFWSGSRSGMVMFIAGAFLFVLFFWNERNRKIMLWHYLSGAAILIVLTVFVLRSEIYEIRIAGVMEDHANIGRLYMLAVFGELFLGRNIFNFLFGHGIESWPALLPHSNFPHNFVLEYLIEFGAITGLLALGTLLFVMVYPLWKSRLDYLSGLINKEGYVMLKLLFLISLTSSLVSLFNHILPTNMTFLFFTGLYLSVFRDTQKKKFQKLTG